MTKRWRILYQEKQIVEWTIVLHLRKKKEATIWKMRNMYKLEVKSNLSVRMEMQIMSGNIF